jgi:hypothetical protein
MDLDFTWRRPAGVGDIGQLPEEVFHRVNAIINCGDLSVAERPTWSKATNTGGGDFAARSLTCCRRSKTLCGEAGHLARQSIHLVGFDHGFATVQPFNSRRI